MRRLFSQRFENALAERTLAIIIPQKLRRRLWYALQKFNEVYYETDDTGWNGRTSRIEQVQNELPKRWGTERLSFQDEVTKSEPWTDSLEGVLLEFPSAYVLDVIELFPDELTGEAPLAFQRHVNEVLDQEQFGWRFADSHFFKLDAEFLSMYVVAAADDILRTHGFAGAGDEFTKARASLDTEDHKEAIQNAGKSFESVMKTMLRRDSGSASELIRELTTSDFFSDLPPSIRAGLGEQVLMTLPSLRNKLSGHGQGREVVHVTRCYAALAVHLAAAFNHFLVSKHLESGPRAEANSRSSSDQVCPDEDLPF